MGSTLFVENSLNHRLESFLEELLDKHRLKLLADCGILLLLGCVLGVSHIQEHGGVHPHVIVSYVIRFHGQDQVILSSACRAPALLMDCRMEVMSRVVNPSLFKAEASSLTVEAPGGSNSSRVSKRPISSINSAFSPGNMVVAPCEKEGLADSGRRI